MFKHLDLFSGIGGFAIAGKWCWGDDYETIAFCDNNKFCQELLKLRFPGVPIINDIRELKYETFKDTFGIGRSQREPEKQEHIGDIGNAGPGDEVGVYKHRVDLITGGFPCQPFSAAGKRKGTDDDRHLWPEMFRVISEFKPTWVIAENVRGLLSIEGGLVFQQVCLDLESIGYEVQPFVIPAYAVNAPHRRDRVWIVGYSPDSFRFHDDDGGHGASQVCREGGNASAGIGNQSFADAQGFTIRPGLCQAGQEQDGDKPSNGGGDVADADRQGPQIGEMQSGDIREERQAFIRKPWDENWVEAATRLCRVDDGLPRGVDGFKLSKSGHRVERLKSLGNAIVPQVAYQIMMAIKYF